MANNDNTKREKTYGVSGALLVDIADAVRTASGEAKEYSLSELPEVILEHRAILQNNKTVSPTTSTQTVTPDSGYNGLRLVTVNPMNLQSKSATPSTSAQTISPDSGYNGLSSVSISAIQTETKTATPSTSQQTITPTSGKYLTSVTVNAIQTETKSATPSTSSQTITPTSGKYLTQVTVDAIQTQEKSTTVNGDITPDSGKYLTKVSVNVPIGKVMQINPVTVSMKSTTMTEQTSTRITVAESGTYDVYWYAGYAYTSDAANSTTQLYVAGSKVGSTTQAKITGTSVHLTQSLTAGQTVGIGLRSASTSRSVIAGNLTIVKQ